MKKVFLLLALLLAFTSIGLGQGSGPITVKEVDGSPVCNNCRTFIFPNGSLTVSGNKVTVASGGGGGTGDVVGPGSATDNAVVRFNTTTGKLVQNSVVLIGDTGNVTGLGTLNTHTIPGGTDTFALLAASQSLLNKKLGSLTSNGLVTTSGGDGTLGVTVPGTGVLTALGVNVGSAGAFVAFNGAGGTPSSIDLTNGSNLPLSTGVTGDLPFANFVQAGSAGFVGATGAGDYSHRTPTQVTAALDAFVGDSGSGGTKGLVPAPVTGDATKFLRGDGTFQSVSASPGGSNTQLQYNNSSAFGGISGATSDGINLTTSSGALRATSPRITTSIFDANGLAIISLNPTASAVNSLQVTNGATGAPGIVDLAAIGSDSDVRLTLTPKGTAGVRVTSGVTTGSGTTAGFQVAVDSLTTGAGASFASSSVTSGSVVNIASTSTAAASNTQTVLNVATSGANGTSTQTTYGAQFANTHTGTSSTNIGLLAVASGGSTNWAAQFQTGFVGFNWTGNTTNRQAWALDAGTGTDGIALRRYSNGLAAAVSGIWRVTTAIATDTFEVQTAAFTIGSATTNVSPARTPSQITADQNNYSPGIGSVYRLSSDASRNITGFTTTANTDGAYIEFWNVGSFDIVLQNENASSTAANRFTTTTGADLTLAAAKCAMGRYDGTTSRWRIRLCN